MTFFAEALDGTELDARAALGFRAREARAVKIVGAMLDVGAKLFGHLVLLARAAAQERGNHISSGRAAKAAATAATRRFQLSVSSRRRL